MSYLLKNHIQQLNNVGQTIHDLIKNNYPMSPDAPQQIKDLITQIQSICTAAHYNQMLQEAKNNPGTPRTITLTKNDIPTSNNIVHLFDKNK